MTIIWRVLLLVGLAFFGLVAGTWIGGRFFVSEGAGLAGGAIALGYGVIGSGMTAAVGIALGFWLRGRRLRHIALAVFAPSLALFIALVVLAYLGERASQDPAEAYAPAGRFTATMERLDRSDPYLFTKMAVDAHDRRWTMTGPPPDYQVCTGRVRAQYLVAMRVALDRLAQMSAEDVRACREAPGAAVKKLNWALLDVDTAGELDIPAACVRDNPVVAGALAAVEAAGRSPTSRVKCR